MIPSGRNTLAVIFYTENPEIGIFMPILQSKSRNRDFQLTIGRIYDILYPHKGVIRW